MTGVVRQLCALSIFCGAALCVMPEGGVKRLAGVACTAALLLCLASAVRGMEMKAYSLELSRYRELGAELSARGEEARDRLDRSVIEAEYGTYISDEAVRLGLPPLRVSVTARWELPGLWMPWEVRLGGTEDAAQRRRLTERLVAELGVAEERIVWDDA